MALIFNSYFILSYLKKYFWYSRDGANSQFLPYFYPFPIVCSLCLCVSCGTLEMALMSQFLIYLCPSLIICCLCLYSLYCEELYIDITNEIIAKIYIINAYNLYIVQSSDNSTVKKEGFFTWSFILIFNTFSNVWSHSYLFILLNLDKFYSLLSRSS